MIRRRDTAQVMIEEADALLTRQEQMTDRAMDLMSRLDLAVDRLTNLLLEKES